MDILIFILQLPWFLLQWFVIIASWAILFTFIWRMFDE